MTRDWTPYRRSLLDAIGVTPAVLGLVLAGCDQVSDAELAPPPPMPELNFAGPLDTGVGLVFQVLFATPGERVWLVAGSGQGQGACPPVLAGECLDVTGASVLGSAVADANGYAAIEATIPYDTPDGEAWFLQAVTTGGGVGLLSNVVAEVTTHPVRDCGEHPFMTPSNYGPFSEYLACAPLPPSGVCPDGPSASYDKQLDLFEIASGQVRTPGVFFPWDINITCNETTIEDACCYRANVFQVVIGRPFTVDGDARVATTIERDGWTTDHAADLGALPDSTRARLAAGWAETAAGEHASVASFARFALQLMRLGAPADLLADATRAMSDEIRHAADAYGIASRFAGRSLGPDTLDTSHADDGASLEELVLSAVREGCIAETIAAAQAQAAHDACTEPAIRETLEGVASDESRHARLAWRFVRWALDEHPELRPAVLAAFAEPLQVSVVQSDADAAVMRTFGHLDEAELQSVAREVFVQVVRPCAAALLGMEKPTVDVQISA